MGKGLFFGMCQQGNVEPLVVPTFILIGDSNADGRGNLGDESTSKYFSEWATGVINGDKATVKIFDFESTDTFVTLNKANAQVNSGLTNFGFEQTIGYGLAKHYGVNEVRLIKYGLGSTTAGGTSGLSWYPGQNQMNIFEGIYADALAAAAAEGVTLDLIGCVTWLGANDGENLTLANNFEANMTAVIEHLRDNVFEDQIPFILTDCPEGVTYNTTVRAAQTSLCGNVPDCTDYNFHRFGSGVHPERAGIFAGGLDIAKTIIVDLLSGVDYSDDFTFKVDTNTNGSYSLALSVNETILGDYIDWGDGNTTIIDARSKTYSHTYLDASTKTIKVGLLVPWNLFNLALGTSIVGTLNLENLTGLDSFSSSTNNTLMTSITDPIVNYNYLIPMPANILNNCGLTSVNFKRYDLTSGTGLNIKNNLYLTSVYDDSVSQKIVTSAPIDIQLNGELITLDIGIWTYVGQMYMKNNYKLTTFVHPSNYPTSIQNWRWCPWNIVLQTFSNYAQSIYATNYEFDNADLTKTMVDNIINEMWDRCRDTTFYRNAVNKNVKLHGNNGFTGTFDGVTDWSGGLPTSPGAKAYDLLNDVTGTYNFSTFLI